MVLHHVWHLSLFSFEMTKEALKQVPVVGSILADWWIESNAYFLFFPGLSSCCRVKVWTSQSTPSPPCANNEYYSLSESPNREGTLGPKTLASIHPLRLRPRHGVRHHLGRPTSPATLRALNPTGRSPWLASSRPHPSIHINTSLHRPTESSRSSFHRHPLRALQLPLTLRRRPSQYRGTLLRGSLSSARGSSSLPALRKQLKLSNLQFFPLLAILAPPIQRLLLCSTPSASGRNHQMATVLLPKLLLRTNQTRRELNPSAMGIQTTLAMLLKRRFRLRNRKMMAQRLRTSPRVMVLTRGNRNCIDTKGWRKKMGFFRREQLWMVIAGIV